MKTSTLIILGLMIGSLVSAYATQNILLSQLLVSTAIISGTLVFRAQAKEATMLVFRGDKEVPAGQLKSNVKTQTEEPEPAMRSVA